MSIANILQPVNGGSIFDIFGAKSDDISSIAQTVASVVSLSNPTVNAIDTQKLSVGQSAVFGGSATISTGSSTMPTWVKPLAIGLGILTALYLIWRFIFKRRR